MPKAIDRESYCSRECYFEAIKSHKPITAKIKKERLALRDIARNNRKEDCIVCGHSFYPGERHRKIYCSIKCQYKRDKERAIELGYLLPNERGCKRCGKIMIKTEQSRGIVIGSKTYCKVCKKLRAKASRKIGCIKRKYQKRVTQYQMIISIEQFIRDDWKCQLCGCDVDELGLTTKDNYANLDHIIPLAKFGQHTLPNVQTLCRKCNILKSDLMPNEVSDLLVHNRIEVIEGWNYKHIKTG